MKSTNKPSGLGRKGSKTLVLVLTMVSCFSLTAVSQQGNPYVASSSAAPTWSTAYVDASAYCSTAGSCGSSDDFCHVLYKALTTSFPNAGVLDARGVDPSKTGSGCSSANDTPFYNGTSYAGSSTVLLPAGTIKISGVWTLPQGTRLIGEGGEDSASPQVQRTVIQAQNGLSPIIQMGSGSGCIGTSIEGVIIDGMGNSSVSGITNPCTDHSYVRRVTLYNILGTGLSVSGANSGPYSDITFDTTTKTTTSSTIGIYLQNATRGVQGITCTNTASGSSYNATQGTCIKVAGAGNTVQDVRVEGLEFGVEVAASNTVLLNIDGDTQPTTNNPTINVVKIDQGVADVAAIGISNSCVSTSQCSSTDYTLYDDSTSAPPPLYASTDPYVSMYVLGDRIEVANQVAYSRYTTSSSTANWSVGAAPSGIPTGTACPAPGSLFSNTNSSTSVQALYVCSAVSGKWSAVK
jgi:hypothetical protein